MKTLCDIFKGELDPKWTRKRDGASVMHSTEHKGCKIIITNWPGTRTMWIEYFNRTGEKWFAEDLDKAEHHVESAKHRAIATLNDRLQRLA